MKFYLFLLSIGFCITAFSQESLEAMNDTVTRSKVFNKVESEARPQEQSSWEKFLRRQIDYDTPNFNGAPRGVYKVKVRFVIQADGKLSDFKALTNKGYGMEREVIRALKKSPPWLPAMQNDKPINAIRIQQVVFDVD